MQEKLDKNILVSVFIKGQKISKGQNCGFLNSPKKYYVLPNNERNFPPTSALENKGSNKGTFLCQIDPN